MRGFKGGYVAGVGKHSYEQVRGAVYRELIKSGVDEETARAAATDEAVISALIESADAGADVLTLGLNSTLGSIGNAAARKAVTLLGKYGINVLGETTEEGLQQSVSIANRNRVRRGEYNPDASWIERGWDLLTNSGETIREAVTDKDPDAASEIWSAAKEGAKLAGMFGGPIAVAHGIAATPVITTQTREKSVQTSGEHDIINTTDAAENGTQAEQTAQAELAAQGEARLHTGEMPTPEQLRAMNLSEAKARGKMVMMQMEEADSGEDVKKKTIEQN